MIKHYISRGIAIALFFFLLGSSISLIGKESSASVFTFWDTLKFNLFVFSVMGVGYFAGKESMEVN